MFKLVICELNNAFLILETKKDSGQSNARWSLAKAAHCILLPYLRYIVFPCEVGCQDEASEPVSVACPTEHRLRSPAKLTRAASPVRVTQWCSAALYV